MQNIGCQSNLILAASAGGSDLDFQRMHPPGESLKQEREARGKTIEEMAEATGIRPHFLAALEEEAFDSLPGRGFGKLYIRAYAEVLGFDPRPVIEAYDQALRGHQAPAPIPGPEPANAPRPVKTMLARWRQERIAARAEAIIAGAAEPEPEDAALEEEFAPEVMEEPAVRTAHPSAEPGARFIEDEPAPPLPVQVASSLHPAPSRRWVAAALFLPVLLPLMVYAVSVAARREPVPREASAPTPSRPAPSQAAEPSGVPPHSPTPVDEPTTPSSLRVAESGVGLRLEGMRLEGEGDRFRSGQRVTFAMRVLGGGAGESIRHVWLRDGKVEQSIPLRLGGASWHTHSTKTLGRPGAWAVEARDEQGRVLARADLTVVP